MTDPYSLAKSFLTADSLSDTLGSFHDMLTYAGLGRDDWRDTYVTLKSTFCSDEAKSLWEILDKKRAVPVYNDGQVARGKKLCIIGAGPCGLRMAIEGALLGARCDVIEMRNYISRNNVLHLWNFVVHDLKALGIKVFYRRFCIGGIHHISIRQLQLAMTKMALVLGVQIHVPVTFEKVVEPTDSCGWRVQVSPPDDPIGDIDFDMVVGADGKRHTLPGFTRKYYRPKQAIAITANFVNRRTTREATIRETGASSMMHNLNWFRDLKENTGVDLENLTYFRDETHYFVMTAKKRGLLATGVLKQDFADTTELLQPTNIDRVALEKYAQQAAEAYTNKELASLDPVVNHRGEKDVAIFDFSAMMQAEHATLVREKNGKILVLAIVGDSLVEPFWPSGTGCGRGFTGVLDTAWVLKEWSVGERPLASIIAERESILKALPNTTSMSLIQKFDMFTIDPATRYTNAVSCGQT